MTEPTKGSIRARVGQDAFFLPACLGEIALRWKTYGEPWATQADRLIEMQAEVAAMGSLLEQPLDSKSGEPGSIPGEPAK